MYWIVNLIVAIWVIFDAKKRRMDPIGWAFGTFLFSPIIVPVYFSKRSLMMGEVREGGTAWNVLKYFAIIWTIFMIFVGAQAIYKVSSTLDTSPNGAYYFGAQIGAGISFVLIAALWFFPMVFALILGFFLKKSSVIEIGPTGKLLSAELKEPKESSPAKEYYNIK
jgi:hypothetical protein